MTWSSEMWMRFVFMGAGFAVGVVFGMIWGLDWAKRKVNRWRMEDRRGE